MAKDGVELVSVTNHFKFQAPDGKQRTADANGQLSLTVILIYRMSEVVSDTTQLKLTATDGILKLNS